MKNLFKISLLLVLLASCTKNARTIIVNTQNADGLTKETKLDVNGFEIGQVMQMNFAEDGSINVVCNLNEEIEIPINSKFYVKDISLLGGKGIGVEFSKENEFIKMGETVEMTFENSKHNSNPFHETINGIIEKLSGKQQTDSLLYELRKLNKNFEDLKLGLENN